MKKHRKLNLFALLTILMVGIFTLPGALANPDNAGNTDQEKACWGQASAVFARAGEMGIHAREQEEPRVGLANLAKALFDEGVIAEPTMQALGAFVADAWGLSIDACM